MEKIIEVSKQVVELLAHSGLDGVEQSTALNIAAALAQQMALVNEIEDLSASASVAE